MKYRIIFSALLVCSAAAISGCDGTSEVTVDTGSTKILDGKASIVLPEGYVKMPEEMLNAKYPQTAQRPSEAWYVESEGGGKVSLAFSMTKNAVKESQLDEFSGVMKQQLSAYSPVISSVTVNGKKMKRIEMTTPDAGNPEGGIYNVMQFSSLDGKLLIATFNSTDDLKDKYTEAGKEALSSLKY